MIGDKELILDTFCEVYDLLKPWMDFEFYDFLKHTPVPGGIYLIGRKQFSDNLEKIKEYIDVCTIILSNPHEGSDTIRGQIRNLGIEELVLEGKILVISGGDIDPRYPNLRYDTFMAKILDYENNLKSAECIDQIFSKKHKPYKFFFLNGLARPHRKYLLEKFKLNGLLDQALWTCLDRKGFNHRSVKLTVDGENLMLRPGEIKYLPPEYEVDRYHQQLAVPVPDDVNFVKFHLFDNQWGEIYLRPEPYIDTYFSLVTETVFDYPYSFRTEKICKPLLMGHPWIVVSSAGYYRDIKNLGFKTFGHLVDESFDQIDNNQSRIDRIHDIVVDLCQQDLVGFLDACQEVCKYNQQHLFEIVPKFKADFPTDFFAFLNRERS